MGDSSLLPPSTQLSQRCCWWRVICWVITIKEVRLWAFVLPVSYPSPDNRTRRDPARRCAAWSPAALWRFCFRTLNVTSHDCWVGLKSALAPASDKIFTAHRSWLFPGGICQYYSSLWGHLWETWENLHKNWPIAATLSETGHRSLTNRCIGAFPVEGLADACLLAGCRLMMTSSRMADIVHKPQCR